jgi:hypothetical protein
MSIILLLGNESPVEAHKPYEDVRATDPDLMSKAQVLKTDTYDPATDEGGPHMVAARLQAYTVPKPIEGVTKGITTMSIAAMDALDAYTEYRGAKNIHFPAGTEPVWVESNDQDLASLMSKRLGIPVGRPADWDELPADYVPPELSAEEPADTPVPDAQFTTPAVNTDAAPVATPEV